MKPDFTKPLPDPEARITALLLGELSSEEADVVRSALTEDPALAALHDRLRQTIELLQEAAKQPDFKAVASPTMSLLSAERREALQATFKTVKAPVANGGRRSDWRDWLPLTAAAAIVLAIGVGIYLPSLSKAKAKGQRSTELSVGRQRELEERLAKVDTFGLAADLAGDERRGREKIVVASQPQITPLYEAKPAIQVNGEAKGDGEEARAQLSRRVHVGGSAGNERQAAPTRAVKPVGADASVADDEANKTRTDARMMMRYGLASKGKAMRGEAQAAAAAPAEGRRDAAGLNQFFFAVTNRAPEPDAARGSYASTGRAWQSLFAESGGAGLGGGGYGGGASAAATTAIPSEPANPAAAWGFDANGADPSRRPASPGLRGLVAAGSQVAQVESLGRTAEQLEVTDAPNGLAKSVVVAHDDAAAVLPEARAVLVTEAGRAAFSVPALEAGNQLKVPVLGNVPAVGQQFTKLAAVDGDAKASRLAATSSPPPSPAAPMAQGKLVAGAGEGELTPLPLKLPIPAFMGSPVDLDFASATEAHRDESRKSAAAAARQLNRHDSSLGERYVNGLAATVNANPSVDRLDGFGSVKAVKHSEQAQARGEVEYLAEVVAERGALAKAKDRNAGDLKDPVGGTVEVDAEPPVALGLVPLFATNGVEQLREKSMAENRSQPASPEPQPEVATSVNPFSTFSLNVADVSYKLAAASLENGAMPDPASIRTEEFINAFDYRDPEPAPGMPVAFSWERVRDPFAHNRDLLRFSIVTAARGREAGRPLNVVLVLDSSGSMERADRVNTVREALRGLASQLQAQDTISVVSFARTPRLWVDGLPGAQAAELPQRVGHLTPEGGTNLEEAMKLGYETARRHFLANGVNRVILLTDGAANLGDVSAESLEKLVQSNRQRGIALDCFGIGWDGYNDSLLEALARHGDGRYGFVNTPDEAASGFVHQLAGALQVAAADVKVQVEFNAARVNAWRQVGYAKHQLTKEQFRDSAVDAAELGAAEAGNALYVVDVNPQGTGPLGVVRARYRIPSTGLYEEHEWTLPYAGPARPLNEASPAMRLVATAANFGEWLASSPFAGEVKPSTLLPLLSGVTQAFEPDSRPQRLEWMIRQAQSISGK